VDLEISVITGACRLLCMSAEPLMTTFQTVKWERNTLKPNHFDNTYFV
jgi:hypothetical protein